LYYCFEVHSLHQTSKATFFLRFCLYPQTQSFKKFLNFHQCSFCRVLYSIAPRWKLKMNFEVIKTKWNIEKNYVLIKTVLESGSQRIQRNTNMQNTKKMTATTTVKEQLIRYSVTQQNSADFWKFQFCWSCSFCLSWCCIMRCCFSDSNTLFCFLLTHILKYWQKLFIN